MASGMVHKELVSGISTADKTNLPYIVTVSRDLAKLARLIGLDTLGYLLEMAAIEAESLKAGASVRDNKAVRSAAPSNAKKKPLPDSALGIYHATAIAHRHLQHAAKLAEGTVIGRRASLREITAAERVITRRQAENRRLLKRLTKKAS